MYEWFFQKFGIFFKNFWSVAKNKNFVTKMCMLFDEKLQNPKFFRVGSMQQLRPIEFFIRFFENGRHLAEYLYTVRFG